MMCNFCLRSSQIGPNTFGWEQSYSILLKNAKIHFKARRTQFRAFTLSLSSFCFSLSWWPFIWLLGVYLLPTFPSIHQKFGNRPKELYIKTRTFTRFFRLSNDFLKVYLTEQLFHVLTELFILHFFRAKSERGMWASKQALVLFRCS